jgi:hypothetical protein
MARGLETMWNRHSAYACRAREKNVVEFVLGGKHGSLMSIIDPNGQKRSYYGYNKPDPPKSGEFVVSLDVKCKEYPNYYR